MDKNIEIEIRGPLSKQKFKELTILFEARGKKIAEKDRILIDYSTFLKGGVKNRHKDIRLRATNGIPEIIVKIGKWGGIDKRKELSVLAKPGEFDTLVQIFAALGFNKGILAIRKSQVYQYKGIEFALVGVPKHSYYYEAEIMAHDQQNVKNITAKIVAECKKLDLRMFNKKQFFAYINQLNQEANKIFDYKKYPSNYFKKRFGL